MNLVTSRQNGCENRRRRPAHGLAHTPGTPLFCTTQEATAGATFDPGPRLRERTRMLRIFFRVRSLRRGPGSKVGHFANK